MARLAVGAAPLLHLRFEHVARTLLQFVTHASFVVAEHRPVVVVEFLDDLERPAPVENVAADDLGFESVGHRFVAGFAQFVARLAEQKVGMTHQLMERVQLAAGALHAFQGLGHGADGLDRRIVDTFWPPGLSLRSSRGTHTRYVKRDTNLRKVCIDSALNGGMLRLEVLSCRVDHSKKAESTTPTNPCSPSASSLSDVGVPTATLRSWNQRYGVGPPEHSPGRHRLYSETDIAVARRMYELIVEGASPRSAARTAIDSVRPARGDAAALLVAAFDFDVFTAGLLLDRHLRHFGVLDTWDQLVRPAFDAIALRQAPRRGLHRRRTRAVLDGVAISAAFPHRCTRRNSSSIILACTSRETHSLALEALRAALVERGRGALMLGADVPRTAIIDAVERKGRPVATLLWSQTEDTADVRTVNDLAAHASVSVGGPGWDAVIEEIQVPRLDSLRAAVDYFAPAG